MGQEHTGVASHVDSALLEVLGYTPSQEEELTDTMDSIQRLELLIALEERLGVSFEDETLTSTWWATRNEILSFVSGSLAAAPAGETG